MDARTEKDNNLPQNAFSLESTLKLDAKWDTKFERSSTVDEPFFPDATSKAVTAKMMHRSFEDGVRYAFNEQSEIIESSYKAKNLSMYRTH